MLTIPNTTVPTQMLSALTSKLKGLALDAQAVGNSLYSLQSKMYMNIPVSGYLSLSSIM
jgi:hypothetical protein